MANNLIHTYPIRRRSFLKNLMVGAGGFFAVGCVGSESRAEVCDFAPEFRDIIDQLDAGELRHVPTSWPVDRGPEFSDFFSVDGNWRSEPNGWSERLIYDPRHKRAHFLGNRWADNTLYTLDLTTLQWSSVGHSGSGECAGMNIGLQTSKEEYRPFNRAYRDNEYLYFMAQGTSAWTNSRYLHRMLLAGPYRFERIGPVYPSNQPITPDWSACHVPGLGHVRSEIDGDTSGLLRVWRPGKDTWDVLAKTRSYGRSNTVYWNPVIGEAIAYGGWGSNVDTKAEIARILPDGSVTEIGPANVGYAGSVSMVTHDPLSGDYLLWKPALHIRDYPPHHVLYRSKDGVEWWVERDWSDTPPFAPQNQRQSLDALPELGVVLWVDHRRGLHVYRPLCD